MRYTAEMARDLVVLSLIIGMVAVAYQIYNVLSELIYF